MAVCFLLYQLSETGPQPSWMYMMFALPHFLSHVSRAMDSISTAASGLGSYLVEVCSEDIGSLGQNCMCRRASYLPAICFRALPRSEPDRLEIVISMLQMADHAEIQEDVGLHIMTRNRRVVCMKAGCVPVPAWRSPKLLDLFRLPVMMAELASSVGSIQCFREDSR